jgi:hypothetical protein
MIIETIENIYTEILAVSQKIESMQYACSKPDSKAYDSKLRKIRTKILDLIEGVVKFLSSSGRLNAWEKSYLKKALLMFSINLNRDNSRAWLQNSLNYIYLATAEPEENVEKEIEEEIAILQENDLIIGIEKLRNILVNSNEKSLNTTS